jgi:hypothetical protein
MSLRIRAAHLLKLTHGLSRNTPQKTNSRVAPTSLIGCTDIFDRLSFLMAAKRSKLPLTSGTSFVARRGPQKIVFFKDELFFRDNCGDSTAVESFFTAENFLARWLRKRRQARLQITRIEHHNGSRQPKRCGGVFKLCWDARMTGRAEA